MPGRPDRREGGREELRRGKALAVAVLAALLAAAGPRPAAAQTRVGDGAGTLWLGGDADRAVPALEARFEVRITGVIARTRLVQRFRNPEDSWLDAVYAFPLPEGAAVDGLRVEIGERRIEGRIVERREARRRFERARDAGQRAALLEQDRTDWFRTAVSAIEPRGEVEVTVEYQELLAPESDGVRWRLPLAAPPRPGAGTAGPAAGQGFDPTGDAAGPEEGEAPGAPVEIRIELDAGFPLAEVASPTHRLETLAATSESRTLRVETTAARDLVVSWRWQRGSAPRVRILSEPGPDGSAAVLLCFLPPDPALAPEPGSRELVLVIDTSGSMAGAPIRHAREALHLALDRLRGGDFFEVVAFDEEPHPLFASSRPATPANLEAAHRFVAGLEASGGTDAAAALAAVLPGADGSAAGSRVRQVVFVSDGGVDEEGPVLSRLAEHLGETRFHAVAIGAGPNGAFLRSAARLGRGSVTFIAAREEVGERMARLFEKLESPVLTDIEVLWNDPVEMWPPRLPDLHAGEPLVATALVPRFVGEVRVRGRLGGRPVEWRLPLSPDGEPSGIARLFARSRIRALEDSRVAGADPERVAAEVLATALRHQIVSSRTSLVAVDVSPRRPASAASRSASSSAPLAETSEPGVVLDGVLPRTATPGPLLRVVGLGLLGAAAGLGGLRPRTRP